MSDGRARLRYALSTLGFLAAAWSLTLVVTRGISFDVGPLHVSSRNVRNPAIGALALLTAAAFLGPAGARARTLARDILDFLLAVASIGRAARHLGRVLDLAMHPRVLSGLAVALVLLTLGFAWRRGAFVAGGADSYGYVSEAHLFATGRLRVDVPLARRFAHVPMDALTPLGYRPADDGTDTLVPTYAPGLPLTMALVERIAGPNAVYIVMPLLTAVAVWGAYWIGVQLAGPGVGLGAALLVVASPAVAFQLVGAPMSDLCAAGWWTLALALLLRNDRWSTALSGTAAGLAILTRPNLLLVVVVLGAYLLWLALQDGRSRERVLRLLLFSAPVIVGCLAVAGFNAAWYGSPFRSGYPTGLFSASYWDDNIVLFSQWLTATQTPIFFLGFAAPLVVRWLPARGDVDLKAATFLLVGVALTVFASYVFYHPFDVWWYLRFLLPGYPALAVLTCLTLAALGVRFGPAARVLCVAAVAVVAVFGLSQVKDVELLGEYRYRIIGEWARNHLPANAIVVSSQHGGNIRHYADLPIVRYDLVAKGDFESALNEMLAAGYHPYLIVDEWEIPHIRQQHGATPRGAIDWPPIAVLPLVNVTVWDLAEDRDAARAAHRTPESIPIPEFIRRQLP